MQLGADPLGWSLGARIALPSFRLSKGPLGLVAECQTLRLYILMNRRRASQAMQPAGHCCLQVATDSDAQ
jgi:hypothetical protein